MPSGPKEAIKAFIEYYNYQRYHGGLGNVTPYDVYSGRHLEIIQRRKEAKSKTLGARRDYNRIAKEHASKVSIILERLIVSLSLTTYSVAQKAILVVHHVYLDRQFNRGAREPRGYGTAGHMPNRR